MTNEAKETAIKYLTGDLTSTANPEQILFDDFFEEANNFEQELSSYFDYGYINIDEKLIQGKTSKGENLDLYVGQGAYYKDQAQTIVSYFIFIIDNKYNIKQVIKQFSNGNDIDNLAYGLNIGEDGKFFYTTRNLNDYKWYLYLLNNFLVKPTSQENYEVVIRQIYEIPYDYANYSIESIDTITKHPQNARYLMIARAINYGSGNTKSEFLINEFTINVGSPNEFINIPMATTELFTYEYVLDIIASWDEDFKILFKAVGLYEVNLNDNRIPFLLEKGFNDDNVSFYAFNNLPDQEGYANFILKDLNTAYYSRSTSEASTPIINTLYKVNLNNKTNSLIATISDISSPRIAGIRLAIINNNIFTFYSENNDFYVGIIINDTIQPTIIPNFVPGTPGDLDEVLFSFNPSNVFNLYSLSIQTTKGNKCYVANIVLVDEDNNQPYINETTLVPYFTKLYDENGDLIFARTLYNKTINGQTTTSSVQIPNQFLNEVQVENEKLMGNTYQEIIDENQTFTKNQYEEVYLNFANTWTMQNQNDPNNIILNIPGATRFNQSTSGTTDYDDCKATKFRLNFNDDTNAIYSFSSGDIVQIDNVPPYTYRYTWDVYVPINKTILSIDIISEDEQTIFQTIGNLNLEGGKLYELTQDVYVV